MKTKVTLIMFALLSISGCTMHGSGGSHDSGLPRSKSDLSSSKANGHPDPCSLVTKDDIATILNATIIDAVADGDDCNYHSQPDGPPTAKISWSHGNAAAGMAGVRAGTKMMGMNQPVEGLGDEAIFVPPAMLYVRRGEDLITVNLVLAPKALDKTKLLAQKALSRL
jgi:hypothetical protein